MTRQEAINYVKMLKEVVEDCFGEKCTEFEKTCGVCIVWKAYELISYELSQVHCFELEE